MRGFDVKTGKRKWIFHTIPRKGEFGYDTWTTPGQAEASRQYRRLGADVGRCGTGPGLCAASNCRRPTCWASPAPAPLCSAKPWWRWTSRPATRKWHYQMIHHGLWDRDISCAGILCDIPHNGKIVKAIAQPTKQGWVYVLDRTTGKPVWPIPEKKVAQGRCAGRMVFAHPAHAPARRRLSHNQGVTEADLVDWTPEIKARALEIASHYHAGLALTIRRRWSATRSSAR